MDEYIEQEVRHILCLTCKNVPLDPRDWDKEELRKYLFDMRNDINTALNVFYYLEDKWT